MNSSGTSKSRDVIRRFYNSQRLKEKEIFTLRLKESSDEESLTFGSEDEEYAMAVKTQKFFREEMSEIIERQEQKSPCGGSWSDSGEEDDEKTKAETCLMVHVSSEELVRNLPKLRYDQHFCDACKIGKQAHASYKSKNIVSMNRCLEPLHMDLLCPSDVGSYRGNLYTLVIVDDYSRSRKPILEFFKVYVLRSKFSLILNTKDYLTKFDPKSYEGVFLRYSQNSKAYIILNKHIMKIEESLNVTFDETPPLSKTSSLVDDDLDEEEAIKVTKKKNLEMTLRMKL
ncbi:retrovirus-related pol polyprotein from transposon TNT 1-94 [Tanacetum coccineum]